MNDPFVSGETESALERFGWTVAVEGAMPEGYREAAYPLDFPRLRVARRTRRARLVAVVVVVLSAGFAALAVATFLAWIAALVFNGDVGLVLWGLMLLAIVVAAAIGITTAAADLPTHDALILEEREARLMLAEYSAPQSVVGLQASSTVDVVPRETRRADVSVFYQLRLRSEGGASRVLHEVADEGEAGTLAAALNEYLEATARYRATKPPLSAERSAT